MLDINTWAGTTSLPQCHRGGLAEVRMIEVPGKPPLKHDLYNLSPSLFAHFFPQRLPIPYPVPSQTLPAIRTSTPRSSLTLTGQDKKGRKSWNDRVV